MSGPIDDYEWRPITFQGVTFPPSLMGVSILEPILGLRDREFIDWIWNLRMCSGTPRSAPANHCFQMAQITVDLMLENRQKILAGIRERLGPHGFDAEETYRDWIAGFQQIKDLASRTEVDCVWSAPRHLNDMKPGDFKRLTEALERERKRRGYSE